MMWMGDRDMTRGSVLGTWAFSINPCFKDNYHLVLSTFTGFKLEAALLLPCWSEAVA
jgi:hypothetical protein